MDTNYELIKIVNNPPYEVILVFIDHRDEAEESHKYTTVSSENITLTQASPSDSLSRIDKNDG